MMAMDTNSLVSMNGGHQQQQERRSDQQLSVEQLFNLFMEATSEVTQARDLLLRTSPAEDHYRDIETVLRSLQTKRDNYQLLLVQRGRASKKSLEFLQGVAQSADYLSRTLPATTTTTTQDAIEQTPEDLSEDDQPLSVIRKRDTREDGSPPSSSTEPTEDSTSTATTTTETSTFITEPIATTAITKPKSPEVAVVTEKSSSTKTTPVETQVQSVPVEKKTEAEKQNGEKESINYKSLLTKETFTKEDIDAIVKCIGSHALPVSDMETLVSSLLQHLKSKPNNDITDVLSNLVFAPQKEDYCTEWDVRYFIVEKFIEVFGTNKDVMDATLALSKVMLRVGNWLRFDFKAKKESNMIRCLKFLKACQLTMKSLRTFKIWEVLERMARETTERGELSKKLMEEAEKRGKELGDQTKKFNVSEFLSTTKRKSSASEVPAVRAASPVSNALVPVKVSGGVKSILKKEGVITPKKSVKFKPDDVLVQIKVITSEYASGQHNGDVKAKDMEKSEGQVLRKAPSQFGVTEIETEVEWKTPMEICFDLGTDPSDLSKPLFPKDTASVTRGGSLELVLADEAINFKRPSVAPGSVIDSPLEPENLVTAPMKFDYSMNGIGVLVQNPAFNMALPTPAQTAAPLGSPGSINASLKRDREESWPSSSEAAKRARLEAGGALSRRMKDDDEFAASRQGILTPKNGKAKRAKPPNKLTPQIIEMRERDVRERVRRGARTLPPSRSSEVCAYFNSPSGCMRKNECMYLHLDPTRRMR